jgi:predicted nucleic acid-binding protein
MIFDTDVFIWLERGNLKAAAAIDACDERIISVQTYMELLQGARSKKHHEQTKNFLHEYQFSVLPITENISHRAAIYIENHALSAGLEAADAIIAATAIEHNQFLMSANVKHFKCIPNLKFKAFKPV